MYVLFDLVPQVHNTPSTGVVLSAHTANIHFGTACTHAHSDCDDS